MKRLISIIILSSTVCIKTTSAQIQCIYCYNQNGQISSGVNNLILNGGFETTTCVPNNWFSSSYCPNSNYYSCGISNWLCTGGGPDTYADIVDASYSKIVEGTKAAYFGNEYATVCSTFTDTTCLSNVSCTVSGISPGHPFSGPTFGGTNGLSLEQTVTGLIVGNMYVLEFWAGGETNQTKPGLFAVDIGFGKTMLRCKPTDTLTGIGTRYIIEFEATNSTHTIKFTNWGHISYNSTELILDDVRLYTLGELSSSVMPCPTGIPETEKNLTINIYPNPSNDLIDIKTESTLIGKTYSIINHLGEIVMNGKIPNEIFSLETSGLSTGVYLFCVGESRTTVKIIKQ